MQTIKGKIQVCKFVILYYIIILQTHKLVFFLFFCRNSAEFNDDHDYLTSVSTFFLKKMWLETTQLNLHQTENKNIV